MDRTTHLSYQPVMEAADYTQVDDSEPVSRRQVSCRLGCTLCSKMAGWRLEQR